MVTRIFLILILWLPLVMSSGQMSSVRCGGAGELECGEVGE